MGISYRSYGSRLVDRLGDDDDNNGDSSTGDNDKTGAGTNDINSSDALDQDEDVIRAAEEAQEEDLDEAVQSAELEVTVTDHERCVASTALSKVSIIIYVYLLAHWSIY